MTNGKESSGKQQAGTDDLLYDYLSDMFGGESAAVPETQMAREDDIQPATLPKQSSASDAHGHADLNGFQDSPSADLNQQQQADRQEQIESVGIRSENRVASTETFTLRTSDYTETPVSDMLSNVQPRAYQPVSVDYSLIPTIKLVRDEDEGLRTRTEAQIVLLSLLYFLRRPLSPRVRQSFLNFSEQAVDDYHASYWLSAQLGKSLR